MRLLAHVKVYNLHGLRRQHELLSKLSADLAANLAFDSDQRLRLCRAAREL